MGGWSVAVASVMDIAQVRSTTAALGTESSLPNVDLSGIGVDRTVQARWLCNPFSLMQIVIYAFSYPNFRMIDHLLLCCDCFDNRILNFPVCLDNEARRDPLQGCRL